MSDPVTVPTGASVEDFLAGAEPAGRREDARVLVQLMSEVTGEEPVMWGPSIVGFGSQAYAYASGRTGDWPVVAFSPRKASMALYGLQHPDREALLDRLGPHKRGASCVWVGRFGGIDLEVLRELVAAAWAARD
ncbi:hypothetical protein GCM10009584_30280 [Ornithinimicrobium humiphilum]|uniref:Uncharacterized protein DUF1801 n=1 Tax=Ornithinimicrobium humiphilum TaxID=125288 RepID=A0A543K6R5_9MICO|nr:DUF1801 domain-containing protein [Ornithinimicrobium humiphilum]TQM90755.1 uncharacterized protein DUF1801 [Ornithinimicrobium humiphilum]